MKLTKPFLILNAIMWLPYGIACLLNPSMPTELAGIMMTSATATTEIRTMYGGVQSALGVMCVLALINVNMVRPALGAIAFTFCGLAIGRITGFTLDSSGSEYTYGAMTFETIAAVTAMVIFVKALPQD